MLEGITLVTSAVLGPQTLSASRPRAEARKGGPRPLPVPGTELSWQHPLPQLGRVPRSGLTPDLPGCLPGQGGSPVDG